MSAAAVRSREKPHAAPCPAATIASSPPEPAVEPAGQPYRGDRWGLIFWLACAGLLVALHVGQHAVYLLR